MLISAVKMTVLNLFQTQYRTLNAQKQKKIKFERRIRLNHNIDKLPDAKETCMRD